MGFDGLLQKRLQFQMLITKKDAVDVVMQMEVNCEDKLEKLKVLLRDDQDEV
jgi:hypothetical protein